MDHNTFEPNSAWRKTATALYRKPLDSKILGSVELDVTELEQYVLEKRKQGIKATLMYPLIMAVARALKTEVPALNCYIKRGKIIPRAQVDAMVSVLLSDDGEMGSVRVPNADAMNLKQISDHILREVIRARKGEENKTMQMKNVLAAIPWPLRNWLTNLIRWLMVDMGIDLPGLGAGPDAFGSFIFSNIGTLGLDVGYPALMPFSNLAIVITMGSPQTKPAVVDGQIVPRRLLTLSAALDHRVVDASHAGQLFKYLKEAVRHPERFE